MWVVRLTCVHNKMIHSVVISKSFVSNKIIFFTYITETWKIALQPEVPIVPCWLMGVNLRERKSLMCPQCCVETGMLKNENKKYKVNRIEWKLVNMKFLFVTYL